MKLKHFIAALQNGVISANSMLQKHHLEMINFYFETREKRSQREQEAAPQYKQPLHFYPSEPDKIDFDSLNDKGLYPKTVNLIFATAARDPETGENYIKNHEVTVPLLTLVPYSQVGVANMKVNLDIELSEDTKDQDAQIGFPKVADCANNEKTCSLEINFEKTTTTDGIKSLMEGYERLLRAQIPG